jgi:sec-independent protein translocase protein TatC
MKSLSILEHIEEFRKRLLEYLFFLVIAIVLSFIFINQILKILIRPINGPLVILAPQDGILAITNIGILAGFIISLPFLLFQIWRYIAKALTDQEKNKIKVYLVLSIILFISGVLLAYFVAIPLGLKFLMSLGSSFFQPMISVREYLSFITFMFLIFGLIFQLPIIILFLEGAGIITRESLKKKRRYFYLAAFIISGVATPTVDAITQIVLAIPLIFLYELAYLIIIFKSKKNIKPITDG